MKPQTNPTITEEQKNFYLANKGRMTRYEIANALGISYSKLKNNLTMLGLTNPRKPEQVEDDGFFNWKTFKNTDIIFQ